LDVKIGFVFPIIASDVFPVDESTVVAGGMVTRVPETHQGEADVREGVVLAST
jgi:hypothetical protein